jgi:hypothetical protein
MRAIVPDQPTAEHLQAAQAAGAAAPGAAPAPTPAAQPALGQAPPAADQAAPPAQGQQSQQGGGGGGGGGDIDEIYDQVIEKLRRELLADRERMGDLLGDLP